MEAVGRSLFSRDRPRLALCLIILPFDHILLDRRIIVDEQEKQLRIDGSFQSGQLPWGSPLRVCPPRENLSASSTWVD